MYQRFHSGWLPGRLCRPRLMKLGQHDDTASISTFTNSLTDVDTALGWSCTLTSLTPAGSELLMRCVVCSSALPRAMMSPPFGHRDTQRNHLTPLVAHLHGGRVT